jgi:hypothetical protein
MLKKVVIVSLVYKEPKKVIDDFLKSICNINYQNYQLILINNGDGKNIPAIKNKNIEIINPGKNLGFCKGSNLGVKKALKDGADYIMLLNSDTTFSTNILAHLASYLDKNSKVGVVAPIILASEKNKEIFYAGGIINQFFGFTRHKYMNQKHQKNLIKSGETDFACGCCAIIRREVFEKIGLLNEKYFIYFDDPDFSMRAKKAGFGVHLLAEPLVFHLNSTNKLNKNAAYLYGRNPFILIRENFPWQYKPTAYLGQFLIRLPRNIFRLNSFDSFVQYLRGLIDGIRGI